MPRNHLDPLDPRFPISLDAPSPVFWQALAPFWCHSSGFAMAESERAGKQAAQQAEAFVLALPPLDDDLPAVTFARVPYPQLEGATLAHEFALTGPLELGPEGSA
jgi:hypothetical protein